MVLRTTHTVWRIYAPYVYHVAIVPVTDLGAASKHPCTTTAIIDHFTAWSRNGTEMHVDTKESGHIESVDDQTSSTWTLIEPVQFSLYVHTSENKFQIRQIVEVITKTNRAETVTKKWDAGSW